MAGKHRKPSDDTQKITDPKTDKLPIVNDPDPKTGPIVTDDDPTPPQGNTAVPGK